MQQFRNTEMVCDLDPDPITLVLKHNICIAVTYFYTNKTAVGLMAQLSAGLSSVNKIHQNHSQILTIAQCLNNPSPNLVQCHLMKL